MSGSRTLAASAAAVAVAGGVAATGSHGGIVLLGVPVFAICVALAFILQWAAFVPAWGWRTERYFDLVGSATFLTLILAALLARDAVDARSLAIASMVAIWALRLGVFLFARIQRQGSDRRFDRIKQDAARFLLAWTLQGLWVSLTLSCALAAMTAATSVPLGWPAAVGIALWSLGFAVEVAADAQKRRFRAQPANAHRFIATGLWALSRHPNYLGEIVLWTGVAITALPALDGWRYVTLISPAVVWMLLTRISGVPLLEAQADRKWGADPAYRAYKAQTPVLVPELRVAIRRVLMLASSRYVSRTPSSRGDP